VTPELAREQRRRRQVLFGMGALTVLGTSPILGHHLARGTHAFLSGGDLFGGLCLVALRTLLAPVHEAFHVALTAGLLYATWDRGRAWWRLQRALRGLTTAPVSESLASAAALAGLDCARLRVVKGLPNPAFTIGWLRPVVYVGAELESRLDIGEITAVLAHERAHVARRDPLRLSTVRFFSHVLFWLPAFRRLSQDFADEIEVVADDAAAAAPLTLASAIVRVASWHHESETTSVGFVGTAGFMRDGMLDRRVRRLVGQPAVPRTHVTRRSLVTVAAMLLLAWTSGIVMAHPLGGSTISRGHHMSLASCDHHRVVAHTRSS